MALVTPTIFLSVAAFLLNVVPARLVGTHREQIAALKAFGDTKTPIGPHYPKPAFTISPSPPGRCCRLTQNQISYPLMESS